VPESAATRTDGPRRVTIEGVRPQVDGGRFPIKRSVGEDVIVEADIFVDGHDAAAAVLRHRRAGDREWVETPMELVENDRWRGRFTVTELGRYGYTIRAWVDRFTSWRRDYEKKVEAGVQEDVDLLVGAEIVDRAIRRARGGGGRVLRRYTAMMRDGDPEAALEEELAEAMAGAPDRSWSATFDRELEVVVDPERARFSSWYELFPRSAADEPGRHGTFRDVERRLTYVSRLGFDVLYLPPIHPIGYTHR